MKVVVFGATGKTGELTWRYAVDVGHEVTVFGRSVEQRYATEPVNKVQGDVLHAEHDREEAIFDADHLDWTAVRAAVLGPAASWRQTRS